MFNRINNSLSDKSQSRLDQAKSYDLTGKPFTSALILRASQYQDDAEKDLRVVVGTIKSVEKDKALNDFATSCAITIAYHITTKAMINIGRNASFLPGSNVPAYAPMVVAYSLLILVGIRGQLQSEGIELDFREMAADTANLFFMAHSDDEGSQNAMNGIEAFQSIVNAGEGNVRDWHDKLIQLIPMYVLQWTSEKHELKNRDFMPLFGSMLSSLLMAVE